MDFISNQDSDDEKRINRNCIVAMIFGARYKPVQFTFYDKDGRIAYNGKFWKSDNALK